MTSRDQDQAGRRKATLAASTLLERLRTGSAGAREELLRRHAGALFASALRFLPRESEARSALEETFRRAFRRVHGCAGDDALSAWLRGLLVDVCVARLAKEAPGVCPAGLEPEFASFGGHRHPVAPWSEDDTPSSERLAEVRRCVQELPAPYRLVLLLKDQEELAVEDIARRLRLSRADVRTRLHRARQALVRLLEPALHHAG